MKKLTDEQVTELVAIETASLMNNLFKKLDNQDQVYVEYLVFQIVGGVVLDRHGLENHKRYVDEQRKNNIKAVEE